MPSVDSCGQSRQPAVIDSTGVPANGPGVPATWRRRTFGIRDLSNSAVIASLWPLTNASTGFLVTVFHYHLSVGREPAEALRRAQRWMRNPDRKAPDGFPEPLARAFEDRSPR
ncbi:CHAT domain-containing protein [Streptomyces sp. NPDC099088]|uniref:CHAT domain-containing protein n=1 Tax=Streptomyces sp. NPDC099088 TaxID=3366101 RepID=UPI003818C527